MGCFCIKINQHIKYISKYYQKAILSPNKTIKESKIKAPSRKNPEKNPYIWDKIFKNGPSKICGRLPLKNLR